jgi:hypothetical protein
MRADLGWRAVASTDRRPRTEEDIMPTTTTATVIRYVAGSLVDPTED